MSTFFGEKSNVGMLQRAVVSTAGDVEKSTELFSNKAEGNHLSYLQDMCQVSGVVFQHIEAERGQQEKFVMAKDPSEAGQMIREDAMLTKSTLINVNTTFANHQSYNDSGAQKVDASRASSMFPRR